MNRFASLVALAAFLLPARAEAQIVYAWGYNAYGELGNNTTTNSDVPVAVLTAGTPLNGQTVTAVAGGEYHSLALANGKVYAWGYNGGGGLGNNSTTDSPVPVAVTTAGTPLSGLTVTAIAGGYYHSLVLASGQVFAWGYNQYGTLGNNSTTQSNVPVAVTTTGTPLQGLTVTAIAAGGYHSLALAGGHVYSWGYNYDGELGINSTTNSFVPVAVTTTGTPLQGQTVTAIAGGTYHSLALANGHVYAWGYNGYGELGNNSTTQSNVPVAVSSTLLNSLTVTQIAAGEYSSYALTSTGRLFAWGDNTYDELGIGSSTTSFTTPQEVLPPSGYIWSSIAIDPTGYHMVATVIPVPDPGALLLLAAGLGLLALRLRR